MADGAACPTPDKIAYTVQADAQKHAAAVARKKGIPFIAAYRCPCGKWHVGRSNRLISKALGPRRYLPGSKRKKW